jgi:hypothetical protein
VFFCGDNSACKSTETCARLQTCTSSPYCETGGTATCPADCTIVAGYCNQRDVCDDNVYATPVVPIAPLPGAATALLASLSAHTPDGYTPTAPALRGAIKQAQQYAVAHPEYKVAVVLVTDGLPGGFTDVYQMGTLVRGYQHAACEPLDIPGIAKLASDAASPPAGSTNPPIPTFVIGVFSDAEASAGVVQPKLDTLASNGGTGSAVIINTNSDVTTALQTALNKIRTTAIACEYKIPPPTSGNIDFMKVNVTFTAGNGTVTTLGYGKDAAACGTKVGWHYDVDPNAGNGNPSSIVICDDNCKQFQSDSAGHVDFQLGCETIIIP